MFASLLASLGAGGMPGAKNKAEKANTINTPKIVLHLFFEEGVIFDLFMMKM